jgi:hypothetical protein
MQGIFIQHDTSFCVTRVNGTRVENRRNAL